MSTLKVKAEVKVKPNEVIQSPVGVLDRQVTGQDLIDEPEKYVKLYPTFYKNLDVLKAEINTRFIKGKSIGKNNKLLVKRADNGIEFAIITSNGNKKKDTTGKDLKLFQSIVAERKKKATKELSEIKKKAALKVEAEAPKVEVEETEKKVTRGRPKSK